MMQILISVSILAANVDIQSSTLPIKEKESKKSVVTAFSKEKKRREQEFLLLSIHHVCFIIYL
jgi:cytoskeletal protein RodZ